jgi:outer membrane protein assembly factor BamB
LYCLDAESGEQIMAKRTNAYADSICIYHDRLFLKCGKTIGDKTVEGFARYTPNVEEDWFHACESWVSMTTYAIADDRLVYSDITGNVYGLDSSNGQELWKTNVAAELSKVLENKAVESDISPYVTQVPVIIENIIVVQIISPADTYGLDLNTGKVLWFYHKYSEFPSGFCLGQVFDNKLWYYYTTEKHLAKHYIGVNIKTGEEELVFDISKDREKIGWSSSRTGLVIGQYHFIGTYSPPQIVAINKLTGNVEWTFPINKYAFSVENNSGIYADHKLIWGTIGGDLYCFE